MDFDIRGRPSADVVFGLVNKCVVSDQGHLSFLLRIEAEHGVNDPVWPWQFKPVDESW